MTNTELKFNTRRYYSNAGQRIGVVVIDTEHDDDFDIDTHKVAFCDIDRGIDGVMRITRLEADAVMAEYDYNRYRYAEYGPERDAVNRARELAATAPSL